MPLTASCPPQAQNDAMLQKLTEALAKVGRTHEAEIEQIVAEERLSRSKMPKYPGLERWILIEKMGDGAFSNVYRARDSTGEDGEVAIKVVRKFEMNSKQVGTADGVNPFFHAAFQVVSIHHWSCLSTRARQRQRVGF
jgi:hypothetical protein